MSLCFFGGVVGSLVLIYLLRSRLLSGCDFCGSGGASLMVRLLASDVYRLDHRNRL